MIKNDFNGWTNKQTWYINLVFGDLFESMAEEYEYDDVAHMADSFDQLVNELELEKLDVNSFARGVVEDYLASVNWEEIAEHYFPVLVPKEDLSRYQAMANRLAE